ncbi:MAG: hypothetical protein Q8Q09_08930 [Deltaproteobacteria bacterium]|nr:hypothetical protein [Deltaproteobacteria bacterium]
MASDDSKYLYERGPWPQPAPQAPDRATPAVLHLPADETRDWNWHVGLRYVSQMLLETPLALLWSLRNKGLKPVSDARFTEILSDGIIGKFLCPTLDAVDRRRFANIVESSENPDRLYKSDFSPMSLIAPDDDSATAPTVVLWERAQPTSGAYVLRAIAVNELVFTPSDHVCWELAKLFALQGAGVCTTLLTHPLLHFPSDAANAITKTYLPRGHLLQQLLLPHFRLQLGVDDAVLHGGGTVLKPGQIYAPYPGTLSEHIALVDTLWSGMRHEDESENSAYPAYRFPREARTYHCPYGTFLSAYFDTILAFTRKVVEKIPKNDPLVRGWAKHIATWITGFPGEDEIFEGDNLARALTSMIHDISIGHSADHYLYSQIDQREVPFKLCAPIPDGSQTLPIVYGSLVRMVDNLRYRMCMKMFFNPHNVTLLMDVNYGFTDSDLRKENAEFISNLHATQQRLVNQGLRQYIPLAAIAPSVQF